MPNAITTRMRLGIAGALLVLAAVAALLMLMGDPAEAVHPGDTVHVDAAADCTVGDG